MAGAVQNSERGVQESESRELVALLDRVHWDDLDVFRKLGDVTSLRRASTLLKLSLNTIRSRIDRLEADLGTRLFVRDRDGLKITAEGRIVLQIANDMRRASVGLPMGKGNNVLVRDGEIRLCVSEGVGTFWLTPRLLELKALLPDLVVSLDSFADQKAILTNTYDISLGFKRPEDAEAIVSKIATIHIMPFASANYLEQRGTPKTLDDMVGHDCVQQDAPGIKSDAINLFFGTELVKDFVRIRVGSSYSLFWAIASGGGIGPLPTYINAISNRVVPVDLPIQLKFELWASYSRAAQHSRPVRATMDWLRHSFDARRYPWFGDRFIHPRDFAAQAGSLHVTPLLDHLIDVQV